MLKINSYLNKFKNKKNFVKFPQHQHTIYRRKKNSERSLCLKILTYILFISSEYYIVFIYLIYIFSE